MKTLEFKQGDTVLFYGTRMNQKTGAADPIDAVSVAMTRLSKRIEFDVAILNPAAGTFTFGLDAAASLLASGSWSADITYTSGGIVTSTETFTVIVRVGI